MGLLVEIERVQVDGIGAVGTDIGHDHLVDSAGEHEATVVVGVLSDEVDTAGRSVKCAFTAEMLVKGFDNLVF